MKSPEVAKPQHGGDGVDVAARDRALHHLGSGLLAEIGLEDGLFDLPHRLNFDERGHVDHGVADDSDVRLVETHVSPRCEGHGVGRAIAKGQGENKVVCETLLFELLEDGKVDGCLGAGQPAAHLGRAFEDEADGAIQIGRGENGAVGHRTSRDAFVRAPVIGGDENLRVERLQ